MRFGGRTIREAQEKKQQEHAAKNNIVIEANPSQENPVMYQPETKNENIVEETKPKRSYKKKEEKDKNGESPTKGKRGRPKKKETDIMEAFSKSKETK